MKVKVKKSVLFNFLKAHLNENRTFENPSGNFVFPFQKDEEPIKPVAHMATQLSVEKPPVEDPWYVPASAQELSSAASVIAKEVPQSQLDYFYRELHKLLDKSLDNDDDRLDRAMLSEGYNLLTESQTEVQTYILSAVKKMQGPEDAERLAQSLSVLTPFENAEMDAIAIEDMLVNAYYEATLGSGALQDAPSAPASPAQAQAQPSPNVIRRKKKEEPALPPETQPEDVDMFPSYKSASDKQEYLRGYDVGLDVSAGITANMPDSPSPDFMAGYDQAIESEKRLDSIDSTSSAQEDKRYQNESAVINIVEMTHDKLFEISRKVEAEYFDAHFTKRGQEARELGVGSDELNKAARKYGLSNDYVFTFLNLTKKKSGQYQYTEQKMVSEVSKFITNYAGMGEAAEYSAMLDKAAAELNKDRKSAIDFIALLLTKKYAQEREQIADVSSDEFLDKKITTLFSIVTKREPYNYKNVSRHFMNRASPEEMQSVLRDVMNDLAKNKKGSEYVFKSGKKKLNYPVADVESMASSYVQTMFDQAADYQFSKPGKGEDVVDDDSPGETEEEAFAKRVAKLSTTTNFDNLAPFFGFSGASGLRQWYLKHALRKIKALGVGTSGPGQKNAFAKLYEETFELIAPYLIEAVESRVKELEAQGNPSEQDKQKLVVIKHSLPQLQKIESMISNGTFLRSGDSSNTGHDLLYTVGGHMLRTVNSEIYKPIMNAIDKNWTDFVADIIKGKAKVDVKKAKSLAEYFTGKKEIPNYNEMTKAAKNLLAAGIDFDMFKEILEISNDWFDDTISTEFSKFETKEDSFSGEFLQAVLKTIEKLTRKPKEMQKALDKAIDEYLKDVSYQIAFRNLSEFETESGD